MSVGAMRCRDVFCDSELSIRAGNWRSPWVSYSIFRFPFPDRDLFFSLWSVALQGSAALIICVDLSVDYIDGQPSLKAQAPWR
jgi:hypothetical protein